VSGSSPADLAVAFRSVPRRLADALEPVGGDRSAVATPVAAVDALLAEAASTLGARSAAPADIAHALEARPADDWAGDALTRLQALALRIGPVIRAVADAAEQAADERRR
jgi:hypothetical protein